MIIYDKNDHASQFKSDVTISSNHENHFSLLHWIKIENYTHKRVNHSPRLPHRRFLTFNHWLLHTQKATGNVCLFIDPQTIEFSRESLSVFSREGRMIVDDNSFMYKLLNSDVTLDVNKITSSWHLSANLTLDATEKQWSSDESINI
jgi:hypothetical protein